MLFWKFVSHRSLLITAAASTVRPSLVSSLTRSSSIGGVLLPKNSWTAKAWMEKKSVLGRFVSVSNHWYTKSNTIGHMRSMALAISSSSSSSDDSGVSTCTSNEVVRVALLQFHVTEDKAMNIRTARDFILRAKDQNAKLVVLPEIWNSPYATSAFAEYAEEILAPPIDEDYESIHSHSPSVSFLLQSAKDHGLWIIGGSIPEKSVEPQTGKVHYYNTCICINPQGKIVAKHRKVHLFDIDVPNKITFRESDTLTGGSNVTTFDAFNGIKIGVGICYDIRFPELTQLMVQRGCNLLVFPGAFNLVTGPAHWELLQRSRAVDSQCFVLTASPARSTTDITSGTKSKYPLYFAWGHSTAVNPWGEVIATCDENDHVVICDLDMSKVEEIRQSIPTRLQKRSDLYKLNDLEKSG